MQQIQVIKDDKIVLTIQANEVRGRIWVLNGGKSMPLVCGASCLSAGIDPKKFAGISEKQWDANNDEYLMQFGENPGGALVIGESESKDRAEARRRSETDALEAAIPGASAMIAAYNAYRNEADRAETVFQRAMDRGDAVLPKAYDSTAENKLAEMQAANPRAALYLKAYRQNLYAHWADNTGKGAAGKRAMEILQSGGSLEEAKTALAVRREFVD